MPMADGYLVSTLRRQSQMAAPASTGRPRTGRYLSPNFTPQPTIAWNGAAQAAEAAAQQNATDFGPNDSGTNGSNGSASSANSKRANRKSGPPPSRSSRLGRPVGWEEVISPIEERTEYGSTAEHSAKNHVNMGIQETGSR